MNSSFCRNLSLLGVTMAGEIQRQSLSSKKKALRKRGPNGETYACRFDVIQDACVAAQKEPHQIRRRAKIHERTWQRMQQGKKVQFSNYIALGKALKLDPMGFIIYPRPEVPPSDIRRAFA